jgi:hypothetical protein
LFNILVEFAVRGIFYLHCMTVHQWNASGVKDEIWLFLNCFSDFVAGVQAAAE